jgi:hypothetical protein
MNVHKCTHAFGQSTRYYSQIIMSLELSGQIFEVTLKYVFMKIHPAGADLFRADGRNDRT